MHNVEMNHKIFFIVFLPLFFFLPLHHNGIGIIVGKTIDFYDLAKIYV
ncbi:hypothetical protein bcere0005_55650 [Bacillus cereus 172560W]|nr:hypothetical protein bcere0005_55650 [Bacillus cereus 172560W]